MKASYHYSHVGLSILMAYTETSVSRLAYLSNTSRSSVSNYKSGARPLTEKAAFRLTSALGYHAEVLDILASVVTETAESFRR